MEKFIDFQHGQEYEKKWKILPITKKSPRRPKNSKETKKSKETKNIQGKRSEARKNQK